MVEGTEKLLKLKYFGIICKDGEMEDEIPEL